MSRRSPISNMSRAKLIRVAQNKSHPDKLKAEIRLSTLKEKRKCKPQN